MLEKYIAEITPLDRAAMDDAQARLDSLVKPPGSLGELEAIALRLAGISGKTRYDPARRCVIVMAADNGVVEEGVSAAPQSVTLAQALNFAKGITGVAVLAKQFGADLIVVDVGINADIDSPFIKNRKIRKSTWNIARQDAMTRDEAERAVLVGAQTAIEAARDGYALIGVGEMGIGNTTTAAATLCALAGIAPESAAGKGAGLREGAYLRKIEAIRAALERGKPDAADPLGTLAKVGGFDIAAMAGAFIGAARARVPAVIDGFISIVAALVAARLCPLAREYMFASHDSFEQGYKHAALALGVQPCLRLNMRLGEGSGCPLMFAIIDAACAIMRDMGTFEQGGIAGEYMEAVKDANFLVRGM